VSLFGKLVRTTVNVAILPVAIARDAVCVVADAGEGKFGPATKGALAQLKREAEDDQ
jgi:hypothetical protein